MMSRIFYKVRAYLPHCKGDVCKKKLNIQKCVAFCGLCLIFAPEIETINIIYQPFKTYLIMTRGDGFALATAFVGGAIAGAAIGLLFAPEKGEDQRAKIKEALEKRGIKLDKETFENLVDEIKNIGKKRECVPAEDFDAE